MHICYGTNYSFPRLSFICGILEMGMKTFLGFSSQTAQLICSFPYLLLQVHALGCVDFKFRNPQKCKVIVTLLCTMGTQNYENLLCIAVGDALFLDSCHHLELAFYSTSTYFIFVSYSQPLSFILPTVVFFFPPVNLETSFPMTLPKISGCSCFFLFVCLFVFISQTSP